jgi:lipopolysaccharide export system protein LptC
MNYGRTEQRQRLQKTAVRVASRVPAGPPLRPRDGRWARIAKFVLPLIALAVGGLIFVWSRVNLEVARLQISDTELAPQEIDSITMENARFAGVDANNWAFNITATRAVQSIGDSNHIDLEQPKADFVLDSGSHMTIRSDAGGLQRNTQILELAGEVSLFQDRGYEFRTSKARIDLNQRTATGDSPIEGHGPQGEIQAEGFQIDDDGTHVIFLGRSRMFFHPQPGQGAP